MSPKPTERGERRERRPLKANSRGGRRSTAPPSVLPDISPSRGEIALAAGVSPSGWRSGFLRRALQRVGEVAEVAAERFDDEGQTGEVFAEGGGQPGQCLICRGEIWWRGALDRRGRERFEVGAER